MHATSAPAAEPFQLEHPPVPPPKPGKIERTESEEASQFPFSVLIGRVYEGPFDLLLDLIRKQNIDVYDIPIARITEQFLTYTRHLKLTDVDAAGEFVYVAALLIQIKSRMLLPRDPVAAGTIEASDDPRRELVERLLEHERMRSAAQMLLQKQQIEDASWTQPGMKRFLNDEGTTDAEGEREIAADTVDLVRVFGEILERLRSRPVHCIDEESVTVAQMLDYLKRRLMLEDRPVSLRRLLRAARTERALICTFLAMLELVRLQAILLRQPEHFGDILVKKTDGFEALIEGAEQVRDDWA